MEFNSSEVSQKLALALKSILQNNPLTLKESESFINQLQQNHFNYCVALINIISNKNDKELVQSSSIQLKNIITQQWKKSFTIELKSYIKEQILFLLINSIDKVELKQYKIIIKKILKYESQWENYMPFISQIFKSAQKCDFNSYCALLCFCLLANKYEFELDNRQVYENYYSSIHIHLVLNFVMLTEKGDLDELGIKILCKIIKIWIKSVKIQPPIEFIQDFNCFSSKLFEYYPKSSQLRRKCLLFFETVYQTFFDSTKSMTKGKDTLTSFVSNDEYSFSLFNYFFSYITDNNKFNIEEDEKSISSCYSFLLLALNRKNKFIFSLIEKNLESLIISSIMNNKQNKRDLELNEKNYIYNQFDVPIYSKRRAISLFFKKISSNDKIGKDALSIIINQLALIEAERLKGNELNILLKESALFLFKVMIKKQKSGDYSGIIHDIVGQCISTELQLGNFSIMNETSIALIALKFRCVDFLNVIVHTKGFNQDEINFLIKQLSEGLLLKDSIIIKTICAITISNLITYSNETISYAKQSITQLISLYISLIKEIELDDLIFSIENIINHYPMETLNFASELLKELIVIFQKYMLELSECEEDEETNIDSATCGIIDLICTLIKKCEKSSILNEMIMNCHDFMCYALSKECGDISMMVFERAILMTANILELIKEIPKNMWKWFEIIMDNLVSISNQKDNPVEGFGFEALHKIMPIVFYFIVKDPHSFLCYYDKTLIVIQSITYISHIKRDELFCCYAIKMLISIFETYDQSVDLIQKSLDKLLPFLIKELELASKQMYIQFLIQAIALVIKINPHFVVKTLNQTNQLNELLGKWVNAIYSMQYEFEYRRSVYGLFSLLFMEYEKIPPTIKNNYTYLVEKVLEILNKLSVITQKKPNLVDEAEVSGDETEEDIYEDSSSINDDFIEHDDEYDEDDDEDYSPENNDVKRAGKKMIATSLEKINVFHWIKNMLECMKNMNNGEQYLLILSKMENSNLSNIINNIN